ncbi:hypothetical protein ACHAXS_007994 [Conticribra weissflogii]
MTFLSDIGSSNYSSISCASEKQENVSSGSDSASVNVTSVDDSQEAIKLILATKKLSRIIVTVCYNETNSSGNRLVPSGLVEALVEKYQEKYPSLTARKVKDALFRYTCNDADSWKENSPSEKITKDGMTEASDLDFPSRLIMIERCISKVEDEMKNYFDEINALKKAREAEKTSSAAEEKGESNKFKRKANDKEQIRIKQTRRRKDTAENRFYQEIFRRYIIEKEKQDRIANGTLATIIDNVKEDMGMHQFTEDTYEFIGKKMRFWYNSRKKEVEKDIDDKEADAVDPTVKKHRMERALFDEIYERYSSEKLIHGGKLPNGALDGIVKQTKKDMGLDTEVNIHRIQAKFKRNHPNFDNKVSNQPELRTLSAETKRRRQLLINEVTARYIKEKDTNKGKLPNCTIDLIISSAKQDLGIYDIDVPKGTIQGRVFRKSLQVLTLGKESPYKAIDNPLIAAINDWLSQGVTVTRDQGLALANSLLRGKNLHIDSNGNEIMLDAKWWRTFLARNKRKLVCSNEDIGSSRFGIC